MKKFIEKFNENVNKYPNLALFYDDANPKGISFSKIDEVSGKIYTYLKSKNIGKEDFVLINLPRGVQVIFAVVGIWKSGAAFTIVEENYAPERIDFIRKDCKCKAEINKDNWDEILELESSTDYVIADDHDAAYAIYTSGTTGNPKGVLHEYGNLTRCVESVKISKDEDLVSPKEHGALVAPLNFVASIMFLIYVLYEGGDLSDVKLYIVSYSTLKNPLALKKFMLEKTISLTFLTPSYVRMLKGTTGPFLKKLIVGSEPANDVYIKGVTIVNYYTMSEAGFVVNSFKIDKAYETCPVGKPTFDDVEIKLLNEMGEEVKDGETGELCFSNPYVRGYINLEEQTKEAFQNGIYHSGDLAQKDAKGNYVLLGRSNDMIKINGNRIEPAEIEAAVKQVLNIDWAAARGFIEPDKSFICAYYKDDIEVDANKVRTELMKRLPYYMIPAYFLKIDKVPLKASGKIDRNALPKPDTKDFVSNYVKPETETEEKLCKAFAKVLKLDRMGIEDDFYEMGGDSLSAIEVIASCDLPGLNASMIFRGRTPKEVAKIYDNSTQNKDGDSDDVKNDNSLKVPHKLTTEQLYMVDYQLYTPKSTMYNLFTMLKFDLELFDMDSLTKAMYTTIKNHPALLTELFFNEDGEVMQKYNPDFIEELRVENISEFDFEQIKDSLVRPFKIINSRLYRCRVFKTEKAGYIFFDVHHTVFDGTSFKVLMANVVKAYMGMELEKDYYYLMLDQREKVVDTPFYEEAKKYFIDNYDDIKYSTHPNIDKESRDNFIGDISSSLDINQVSISEIEKVYKITRNEFFLTVAALAISTYNKEDNIKLSWIYNGREDINTMNSIGLMFRDLPVKFNFTKSTTIRDIYDSVHNQVQKDIMYSCYPYVEMNAQQGISDGELTCVLYQRDIRDVGSFDGMDIETIDIRQNQAASENILDIQILDGAEGLQVAIDYAASKYNKESIEKFKDLYIKIAHILIDNASQKDITIDEIKKNLNDNKISLSKILSIFTKKR